MLLTFEKFLNENVVWFPFFVKFSFSFIFSLITLFHLVMLRLSSESMNWKEKLNSLVMRCTSLDYTLLIRSLYSSFPKRILLTPSNITSKGYIRISFNFQFFRNWSYFTNLASIVSLNCLLWLIYAKIQSIEFELNCLIFRNWACIKI